MQNPFSTKSEGIGGDIKRRYADFIVEEIQTDHSKRAVTRFVQENASESATPIEIPEKPKDSAYQHLHFDLEKINLDTNSAVSRIARFFHLSRKRIGYAGLKDKRGITCQRISAYEPDVETIKKFQSRGIDLRNFEWKKNKIEIGDLTGNAFTLIIRHIDFDITETGKRLEKNLMEIEQNGVANYFGEQRFGGIRNITHKVGKELVRGNFENAVMMYLTEPSEKEPVELTNVRKELKESKNFLAAARTFSENNRFEAALCQHLHQHPKDFVGALAVLPKAMRYLFTHAYQSHLFNEIIAERIKQGFGITPISGDVLENGSPTAPLFGYETKFSDADAGKIEKTVMASQGVSLTQFRIPQMAELSSKGSRKKIVLHPNNMKVLEITEDELNEGKTKVKLYFELEKGSYATTVLNEIIKNTGSA
ncbi:MAG: tRNA pseudouridine(13) synthase TruD [Candidatus Micrarchaeota archaeon]